MESKEYVATLVSRMSYIPKTVNEVMTIKEHLLAEYLEQDRGLNDLLKRMSDDQLEVRMKFEHDKQLDEIFAQLG